jgi:hypothetical protein
MTLTVQQVVSEGSSQKESELETTLNERNDLDEKEIYLKEIEKLREEKDKILEDIASYAGCKATAEDIKSVIATGMNAVELIDEAQRIVENQQNTQNIKINEYVLYLTNMEKKLEEEKQELENDVETANIAIKRLKNAFECLKCENVHSKAISRVLNKINEKKTMFKGMRVLGLDLTPLQKIAILSIVFFSTVVVGVIVGITLVNIN